MFQLYEKIFYYLHYLQYHNPTSYIWDFILSYVSKKELKHII